MTVGPWGIFLGAFLAATGVDAGSVPGRASRPATRLLALPALPAIDQIWSGAGGRGNRISTRQQRLYFLAAEDRLSPFPTWCGLIPDRYGLCVLVRRSLAGQNFQVAVSRHAGLFRLHSHTSKTVSTNVNSGQRMQKMTTLIVS